MVGSALADIAQAAEDADVRGPALLIVGDVVGLSERIAWFGADRAAAPRVR